MALDLAMTLVAIHLTAAPDIPAKTLEAAQHQAAHILASAHVKILWVDRADLRMQIVGGELRGLDIGAAGFAVLIPGDSGYAAVSWPAVSRQAAQMEIDPAILLGAAMAHELGHLLYGPAHTHGGIMSARFGPKEMQQATRGELVFEFRR